MLNIVNHRRAFSLVELLVSISVLAILGAIIVSTTLSALDSSKITDGVSKLRNIGTAMRLYTLDNGGYMPGNQPNGAIWEGQTAEYDSTEPGRLVVTLAPYLDYPDPQPGDYLNEEFIPIAYDNESNNPSATIYVTNQTVTIDGMTHRPFGVQEAASGGEGAQSSMLASRVNELFPDAWALSDADQIHPEAAGAFWGGRSPSEPIYGDVRNVLLFNGSVESVPVSDGNFAWLD